MNCLDDGRTSFPLDVKISLAMQCINTGFLEGRDKTSKLLSRKKKNSKCGVRIFEEIKF